MRQEEKQKAAEAEKIGKAVDFKAKKAAELKATQVAEEVAW